MEKVLYELHYDVTLDGVRLIIFPVFALVFLWQFISKKREKKKSAWIYLSALAFFLFLSFGVISVEAKNYEYLKRRYESKNFMSVEGYVEQFFSLGADANRPETFEINGVEFSYSAGDNVLGYHRPQYCRGVVKEGQYLRIGYIEKISYDNEIQRIILSIVEINQEN